MGRSHSWASEAHLTSAGSRFRILQSLVPSDLRVTEYVLTDIIGTSDPLALSFNMSISYADFWTDSPADSIFHVKHSEVYPGTECTYRYAQNGGYNLIQNKNFWIQFYFNDGSQASFNIPQGYTATYYRTLFTAFYTNCVCPS